MTRASDEYVVKHFDEFAPTFDRLSTENLRYRTPEALAATVTPMVDDRAGAVDVLDAGCGTGLCGPLLRPLARRLVGVDLSPGMLAVARERGIYDELAEEELTAFLRRSAGAYDVIVAPTCSSTSATSAR